MNTEQIKNLAKKHEKNHGRPTKMTDELLDLTRKLRISGLSIASIYTALEETGNMPYKSYIGFNTAYRNR